MESMNNASGSNANRLVREDVEGGVKVNTDKIVKKKNPFSTSEKNGGKQSKIK